MPRDILLQAYSPPLSNKQRGRAAMTGGNTAVMPEASANFTASNASNGQSALRNEQTLQFFIKSMMYTFGDCRQPLEITVDAVQKTLYEQMQTLYRLASQLSKKRNVGTVEVLDIVFIYRKDVSMLHRIYRRLSARQQAKKLQQFMDDKPQSNDEDKLAQEMSEAFNEIGDEKLLQVLDDSYVDSLRQERLTQMDNRTRNMDQEEYFEYHQARGISFASSAAARKVFFLFLNKNAGWRLTTNACELLALIAYEVVAKLTEAAVAIRAIARSGTEEEFQNSTIGRQYNADYVCNNPLFKRDFIEAPHSPTSQLQNAEPLEPKDIFEALRRLQECKKPIFCQSETTDFLKLI